MKKKRMIPIAVVVAVAAVGTASLVAAHSVSAVTTGGSLVERLASTFNLNKEDVQKVFDENRAERQAERIAEISEDLQDKVDDGDITAEQKTLIEQKLTELQTERDTERDELEVWAEQNSIELRYLLGGRHHGSDARLQDAVDDGDITAEQKTLIEQKQEELQTKREEQRDALQSWAKENDIDLGDLRIHGFGDRHRGHGFGPMM